MRAASHRAGAAAPGAGILAFARSIPPSVLGRIRTRIAAAATAGAGGPGPAAARRRSSKFRFSERHGAEESILPTTRMVVPRSCSCGPDKGSSTMRRRSRCSTTTTTKTAATVLAANLLIPPWISRAVIYLSSSSSFRYGESSSVDWWYNNSNAASALREMTEMTTMAFLQDLTVGAVACCVAFLPGFILSTGTSSTKRMPSMVANARRILALLFATTAYLLFIFPVWLDLLSQLLTGMRIRHDYVMLTLRNLDMFYTSLSSFYSNWYDVRVVAVVLVVVWSFRTFLEATYVLALSSRCGRGSDASGRRCTSATSPTCDNCANNTTTNSRRQPFRILGRTLRRYCARPFGLLLGLASMYTLTSVTVMVSLTASRTSTSSALHASNVVFLMCAEAMGVPYLDPTSDGFLLPSSIGVTFNKGTKPDFVAPSERFVDWDANYPFYRRTLGYQGPKAFHINSLPDNRRPNVVMIMLETWRHRDVGVLGGMERLRKRNRTATPSFDRLSQKGILFDNFHANGVQTSRTLMSTLFGTLPQFTTSAAIDSPTAPLLNMSGLPSLLKGMGYRTVFASATGLDYQGWDKFLPSHGFDFLMGIDEFEKRWHDNELNRTRGLNNTQALRRLQSAEASGSVELDEQEDYDDYNYTLEDNDDYTPYEHMEDDVMEYNYEDFDYSYTETTPYESEPHHTSWGMADDASFPILGDEIINLASSEQPFFVDYYSISSHHPFEVPWTYHAPDWIAEEAGDNDDYRKYLQVISYTDKALGDFFDRMEEQGIMNKTIFLVSGDHGFGFCEHKPCYDGLNIGNANAKIYDEVVRVPFLTVAGSNLIPAPFRGKVVHEAASQVDVMATAMDMVGVPSAGFPQHGIGRSLMRKTPAGLDTAVLQNTFNDIAMGQKVGTVKYIYEGNRMIEVYNMSGRSNNESSPAYSHRMETGGDALWGAPRDVLRVKDRIAKLLHDTMHCYETNKFMPPGEIELGEEKQNRTNS